MRRALLTLLSVSVSLALSGCFAKFSSEGPQVAEQWRSQGVFLSDARLATLKRRVAEQVEPTASAYKAVLADAEKALTREPQAPLKWFVPNVRRDTEGHVRAKGALEGDGCHAYAAALCYRLSGDERYAAAAAKLLNAWAVRLQVLETEEDSKLSFSYHFPALLFAAGLLKKSPSWPPEAQSVFRRFVREKALPLNTMASRNNWGNWGLVLVLASAAFLDDRELFAEGVARWKELLGAQVAEDGHLPLETKRDRRGLWYTHFCLMPQTLAAEIARVNGLDLFNLELSNGRSLRLAYQSVPGWVAKPETYPFWTGDPKALEGTDYISYFEILDAHWPSPQTRELLQARRPLSGTHSAPFLTFTHGGLLNDAGP
jgi:hypothetical protein